MNTNDIISSGLLELYASGMASKEEALQVQQWIKNYPEVAAEFASIEASLEALAREHAIQPAEGVKEGLFARINTHKQAPVIPLQADTKTHLHNGAYWKWAAAAAIALLIGSVATNISIYGKYDTVKTDLQQSQQQLVTMPKTGSDTAAINGVQTKLQQAQQQLAAIQKTDSALKQDMELAQTKLQQSQQLLADAQESNSDMQQDMHVVQSKYSEPIALHGLATNPDAVAKVFWMKNTGEVYIDPSNLPDLPLGKQFQFWAIVDGKPVDGGMIITSGKGTKYRIQKMKSFGSAQAFAITIEKTGGSPAPTMDQMVVMGKM